MKLRVVAVILVLAAAVSVWAHSPAQPAKKAGPALESLQAQVDQLRAKLNRVQASLDELRAKLLPVPKTKKEPSSSRSDNYSYTGGSHIQVWLFQDEMGELWCQLDGRPVQLADLGAEMKRTVARYEAAGLRPEFLHGKITAAGSVRYKDVIRVLDMFMHRGITDVAFQKAEPLKVMHTGK